MVLSPQTVKMVDTAKGISRLQTCNTTAIFDAIINKYNTQSSTQGTGT